MHKYDIAVIGCGIAGMATACRLQAAGKKTVIFEAHGQPGGCAGYFVKKGFSFDVGATTLVDFEPGGIGGELLSSIGLTMPESEALDYQLWLPDRCVNLYRDKTRWHQERLEKLGNTSAHRKFWYLMDYLADTFWKASRRGLKLPLQNATDVINAFSYIGLRNLPSVLFLNYSMADVLKKYGLDNDVPLKAFLSMLIEDTVNSTLNDAPLINSALGITIRGAGLRRAKGGMRGFWNSIVQHYKSIGGTLLTGQRVEAIAVHQDIYSIKTRKGIFYCDKLVSALPAESTAALAPDNIKSKLGYYVSRDKNCYESAIVVFLGVPETEVTDHELTHHQLLYDYDLPLGNGNNMFISVSSANDTLSAPAGFRSVMISTHCKVSEWQGLSETEYQAQKEAAGRHLLKLAKKVYPNLGNNSLVYEIGTPRSYERYTNRINGTAGGIRQNLGNANFKAMPHDIGIKNFRMAGDTTWPGLGTVACIAGSRIVANQLLRE